MNKILSGLLAGMMILSSTMAFAETVYATKNGKKYHHAECPLINKKSPAAVSMEEAGSRGLTPCAKCFKKDGEAVNK